MHVLSKVPKVVGMYLSDNGNVYNNRSLPISKYQSTIEPEVSKYIPILNAITVNLESGIKFCDLEDQRNEIELYDKNMVVNKTLSPNAIKTKKIDVTANDLYAGPIVLVMNFTGLRLAVRLTNGIRKLYLPLTSEKFGDFKGKVVIMSIHTLNSPQMVREVSDRGNYLEDMLNEYRKSSTYFQNEEPKEVIEYVLRHWDSVKPVDQMRQSNSIKVVTSVEVDCNEIVSSPTKSIWLSDKEWTLSFDDILANYPGIEGLAKVSNAVVSDNGHLKNGLTCYIVDNKNQIGDRFMHIAGTTFKINKTKDLTLPDGLYLIQLGADGSVVQQEHTPLHEIDKNEHVFRSMEEARHGADLRTKYKDELEDRRQMLEAERLELSNKSLQEKARYEELVRNLEMEAKERDLQFKEKENQFKKRLQKLQEESENSKSRREEKSYRLKNSYEKKKYQRDTTLDTIKTIGSIAGLLAGGFVIYSKLSRK